MMDLLFGSTAGRAALVVALLAVVSLARWFLSRRSGTMRATHPRATRPRLTGLHTAGAAPQIDLAALGVVPGSRATFVQFSSEICAPCRHVARVLTGLSTHEVGVVHVDLDVTQHAKLVRAHGVLRTPTVLLLGPDGTIHGRTSGPMTPVQARQALDTLALRPLSPPSPPTPPSPLSPPRPAQPPAPPCRPRAVAALKDIR